MTITHTLTLSGHSSWAWTPNATSVRVNFPKGPNKAKFTFGDIQPERRVDGKRILPLLGDLEITYFNLTDEQYNQITQMYNPVNQLGSLNYYSGVATGKGATASYDTSWVEASNVAWGLPPALQTEEIKGVIVNNLTLTFNDVAIDIVRRWGNGWGTVILL